MEKFEAYILQLSMTQIEFVYLYVMVLSVFFLVVLGILFFELRKVSVLNIRNQKLEREKVAMVTKIRWSIAYVSGEAGIKKKEMLKVLMSTGRVRPFPEIENK